MPGLRLHERLRAAIEIEGVVSFWGREYTITPRLVPVVFGDGRALVHVTPLLTRPNYFVVRGDSSWLHEEYRTQVSGDFSEWLEHGDWCIADSEYGHMECCGGGVYEAIEEAFGRWRDSEDRDEEDTDDDYEWPCVDLGFGTCWGLYRLGREHPWGRIPEEWLTGSQKEV